MSSTRVVRLYFLSMGLAGGILCGLPCPAGGQLVSETAVAVRAQIGSLQSVEVERVPTSTWQTGDNEHSHREGSAEDEPSLWKHLGLGLAVGAAVGLGVGLYLDTTVDGVNYIPVTLTTLPAGAILGTITGGVVWLVRR